MRIVTMLAVLALLIAAPVYAGEVLADGPFSGVNLDSLPKEQAAENLRAMIRLAKSRGIDVLLIGTPEPGFTLTPAAFYAEIAKEFRIPYEGEVLVWTR